MPTTRLSRSVPFWVLVGGSIVLIAGGAYLLVAKLSLMADTLTAGTATGVEVYAGQIWAVLGAVLVGAGVVGLALALTLGVLGSLLRPTAPVPVEVVEPAVWDTDDALVATGSLTVAEPVVEPVVESETAAPAVAFSETPEAPEAPAR